MRLELDTDLLALLPPWYRRILDYQQLCLAEGKELEALAAAITAVGDNLFFQTMDEGAVRRWERVFRILPDPETETLEFRRARLISRIATQPPFTLEFLKRKLDELVGPGLWAVTVDYPNYTLYIESAAKNQSYAQEIAVTLHHIKPAHMVYVNRPLVRDALLLSHQASVGRPIYNYQLGAWALGALPFASLQDLGVIILPEQPSIQPALLSDTAAFAAADVAAVRLNGTVSLPGDEISKTVQGGTVTLEYTVTAAQVPAVNRVELLNADGETLASGAVYVPVEGPVLFKHTITVKEGA